MNSNQFVPLPNATCPRRQREFAFFSRSKMLRTQQQHKIRRCFNQSICLAILPLLSVSALSCNRLWISRFAKVLHVVDFASGIEKQHNFERAMLAFRCWMPMWCAQSVHACAVCLFPRIYMEVNCRRLVIHRRARVTLKMYFMFLLRSWQTILRWMLTLWVSAKQMK